jgi:hypothetical protein
MRLDDDTARWLDDAAAWWIRSIGRAISCGGQRREVLDRLRSIVPPQSHDGPYR